MKQDEWGGILVSLDLRFDLPLVTLEVFDEALDLVCYVARVAPEDLEAGFEDSKLFD